MLNLTWGSAAAGLAWAIALLTNLQAAKAAPANGKPVVPNVLDHPRADYDATGIAIDNFVLFPKLTLGTQYDDNIFATPIDEASDAIFHIAPALLLKSPWQSADLSLSVHGRLDRYAAHDSENTNAYGANFDGRISPLEFTMVIASISFDHDRLSRQSTLSRRDSVHPIEYNAAVADLAFRQEFGHLHLAASGQWRTTAYQNGVNAAGDVLFEKALNYQATSGTFRADYLISPDTALFASVALLDGAYALKPPEVATNRSSNGYEITGGLSLHWTDLLVGDIGVGYLRQNYPHLDSQEVKNLAVHTSLVWYPTLLTTVKLNVNRAVREAPTELSGGYVDTDYSIEVDHELRRNVILTAAGEFTNNDFEGVNRHDVDWRASFAASYLFNRIMSLKLEYRHDSRESSGLVRGLSFDSNSLSLSVVLQK